MTIKIKQDGTTLEVALEGRLDGVTAPDLEEALKDKLNDIEELILDFSGVEYISSAGLRVLLSFHKTMYGKGKMKVIHANEIVHEVFEVTGFDSVLDIE